MTEGGPIVAVPQPVPAGRGVDADAVRQLVRRSQLGDHDRRVPDGGSDDRVAALVQRIEQRGRWQFLAGPGLHLASYGVSSGVLHVTWSTGALGDGMSPIRGRTAVPGG